MNITSLAGLTALAICSITAKNYDNSLPIDNYHTAIVDNCAPPEAPPDVPRTRIQVALLLDTSNSMDGLIDQAKSRLWNIVNTLTTLRYRSKQPVLEIALYEYGNDGLSSRDNYIRRVAAFTTDLDLISEKLFALRTNGGNEYCGAVIRDATRALTWSSNRADMKLLYIAGNEPFNQGGISYKEAIGDAREKSIFVNTIYCGDRSDGISTYWKDGADLGRGKYFNINSNERIRYIETPYDARIEDCNRRLNDTYIGYGRHGADKKTAQAREDRNAAQMSAGNSVERSITKSKKGYYDNSTWDLVDYAEKNANALSNLKEEDLPAELQGKNDAERKAYIAAKQKERADIQAEIAALSKQRSAYIEQESKSSPGQDDLGSAIKSSIMEAAQLNGYTVMDN